MKQLTRTNDLDGLSYSSVCENMCVYIVLYLVLLALATVGILNVILMFSHLRSGSTLHRGNIQVNSSIPNWIAQMDPLKRSTNWPSQMDSPVDPPIRCLDSENSERTHTDMRKGTQEHRNSHSEPLCFERTVSTTLHIITHNPL